MVFSIFTAVKIEPINSLEFINMFHTILSDCAQPSDCPNEGKNYNCTANVCTCLSGHTLDGDACVGMCYNRLGWLIEASTLENPRPRPRISRVFEAEGQNFQTF